MWYYYYMFNGITKYHVSTKFHYSNLGFSPFYCLSQTIEIPHHLSHTTHSYKWIIPYSVTLCIIFGQGILIFLPLQGTNGIIQVDIIIICHNGISFIYYKNFPFLLSQSNNRISLI